MPKYLIACLLGASVVSCSSLPIHKLEIEQGNIIDSKQVNRIHRGMSQSEVKAILGAPVLENVVRNGDLCYTYTFQIGADPRTEKRLLLVFHHGALEGIQREGI